MNRNLINYSKIVLIYFAISLVCCPAAFSQNSCECHMPPLEENQMAKYSSFVNKKKSKKLRTSGGVSITKAALAPGESRPYEGLRPAVGEHKTLALLVDFDDKPYYGVNAGKRSREYFEDILFDESRNSMNRYYKQVSGGAMSFGGKVLKVDAGEGAGAYWYRSLKPYSFWGNDVEAFETIDSPDISYLASEVIENASRHVDFSSFDADRDGVISPYELHIIILHSGSGQERSADSSDIWSHRSTLDTAVKAGGVIIENYMLLAHDSPLGVFCHETGHDLGLFDIYDTFSGSSVLGGWSLMDRGAWNGIFPKSPGAVPSFPSAYERAALGWIEPYAAGSARSELYLKSASSGKKITRLNGYDVADAVKIEVPGTGGSEYLLFENRHKMPNTFDDDAPPLLKRENGVLAYHVNEKMPDRTSYQYANDSRNSFYRVNIAQPPAAGPDLSYYDGEFSRYTSKLQKFYNGAPNLVRMNCLEQSGEFMKVAFNLPYAHFSGYEISFSGSEFDVKASFSHYNKGLSSISAYLNIKNEAGAGSPESYRYFSEMPLIENDALTGAYYAKKINASGLKLLDSDRYYARFVLSDGEYKEERTFGPFEIKSGRDKYLKITPAAVNKGEITVNVYLSQRASLNPEDTEEVYYSFFDSKGYKIEKQAIDYQKISALWNYRSYKFFAGDEAASDIFIRVVSKFPEAEVFTGSVELVRTKPQISHGVYSAPLISDTLTIMAESDRKLFQAQLIAAENARDTFSVGMYARSGVS
ncbi:MAG TPA: M6 family metalloprotease domain-containing protein, partial [Candidatus Wallbacteria bacterium]|nr:M6 family metalloprotease domain-containing protein [Candidatus Wallbacteria bacterium]